MQAQLSDDDHLAITDPHVHKGRRTRSVHHHRLTQLPRELPGRREMIGVSMSVDQVADTQTVSGSERNVVVNLADFRIDQRRRASLAAADKIGLTSTCCNLFEDHFALLWMTVRRSIPCTG